MSKIYISKNHDKVLAVLGGGIPLSLSQVTYSVDFTQHTTRVLLILLDLSDAGLAHFHDSGSWLITPQGRRRLSDKGIKPVRREQRRGRGRPPRSTSTYDRPVSVGH
jgi:hypothetical protein